MIFAFNQSSKTTKAAHIVCALHGVNSLSEGTFRDWYAKFQNGDIHVWRSSWVRWKVIKPLFTWKCASNGKRIGIENRILSQYYQGPSLDGGVWAWSDNNRKQRATISTGVLARRDSTYRHKQRVLYWIRKSYRFHSFSTSLDFLYRASFNTDAKLQAWLDAFFES